MILTPQLIESYKELLTNPKEHGLPFEPITEVFEKVDTVTPKHILYVNFMDWFKRDLPKLIFYIIMDDLFADRIDKDPITSNMGYKLKIKEKQ